MSRFILISILFAIATGCGEPEDRPVGFNVDTVFATSGAEKLELAPSSRRYSRPAETSKAFEQCVCTAMIGGEKSVKWLMPRLKKSIVEAARECGLLLQEDCAPDLSLNGTTLFFSLIFRNSDVAIVVEAAVTDETLAACEKERGTFNLKLTVRRIRS